MRVTAVVPALDEAPTVGAVVRTCLPLVDEVLVVDGGSRDATCTVAAAAGARVIRLGQRGKGLAIQRALREDLGELVVFIDADGSHRPADIPRLLAPLRAGQADLVALINEQTEVLNDLTTRLLTTARLDAGDVTVHAIRVNVSSMIEEILLALKDRLASMKVVLDLPDDGFELNCDRQLMIMLLTQYVDNACKYSILGTPITIRVAVQGGEAVFSVHGFSPAIPVADRERIFERYYRSSKSSTSASGTGIGLSVAKRVAQVHGGHVWVTSGEVEGTTFYAAIPLGGNKESKA